MPEFISDVGDAVGDIFEGVADALPQALVVAAVASGFGLPFLPVLGTQLVLGGLSRALAPDPETPSSAQPDISAQGAGSSRLVTVKQPISYWQIIYGRRRVGGVITYVEVSSDNQTLDLVVTWAGHVCQSIDAIWFGDEEVPLDGSGNATGRYAGYVSIKHSLGAESGQPFAGLVAGSAGKWIDADRQTGRTKSWIRLTFNQDLFPGGIPNITAVIKGVCDIYDPRSATRGWSDNNALCSANYMENATFGMGVTLLTEINQTQLTAAANDCDDAISLAAGGSEDRYTLNMVFDTSEQPADVLEAMANAMAGRIAHVGDTWYIFAGVYEAPTVALDDGDLAGPVRSQSLVSMAENLNAVKGTFTDPASDWQPTDFPALASTTYLAEDNNVRRWGELRLAATVTSGTQAQRIAKIHLLRTRQAETFSAPFKLSALRLIAGGTFTMTMPKYGYVAKAFEVTSWGFALGQDGELVIMVGARETAAAIFDWSTSEEQTVDLAPNTNLPDPFAVSVPGAPTIVESTYETLSGSGTKAQALVSWVAAADFMVEQYQLRHKLAADADVEANWNTRAPVRGLQETLPDLAPAVYDFAVRAINFYGVRSSWQTTRKEIFGLNTAPVSLSGVSIQAAGGLALLRWDLHPALYVREGGWIVWRHSEETVAASASWEQSLSIGDAVPGNNNQAALPLKPGTYLGKAMSQRGILSTTETKIATKQATILNYANVSTLQEDSTFTGTHSNTVVSDGAVKIAGMGLFDYIPDFDTIAALDSFGGVAGAGTYTFAAGLDLGAVQNVRLTSQLVAVISNVNDLIDERAGDIDDWEDFDGTIGAPADAYIECRETDDNPASSPSWSAWKRLDAAEFQARGFDFRAQLITADSSYNVALSQVRVKAAQLY